jgi:PEP-CTERM/exosortase A-associated glycosyltransferase
MSAQRLLIVNADGFGRTTGINRGVIEAVEHGVVTSASMMVRWPAAAEAAQYARRSPRLSVGLHVDLSEWTIGPDGWSLAYQVVPTDDADAVATELRRQLETFMDLVGRAPTHLDSHQDVHTSEPARRAVQSLADSLGIPVRHGGSAIRCRSDFYAQNSQGYSMTELVGVDALVAIIRSIGLGVTELVCHPAAIADAPGTYNGERVIETATLCDPRVREAIEEEGIRLGSFGDLPLEIAGVLRFRTSPHWDSGFAAAHRGALDEAARHFQAAAPEVGSAIAWLSLSRSSLTGGDALTARAFIERALAVDPSMIDAHLVLADIEAADGRHGDAVERLRRLAREQAGNGAVAQEVCSRLIQLGRHEECLEVAAQHLASSPKDRHALAFKAIALVSGGRETEALTIFQRLPRDAYESLASSAVSIFLELDDPVAAWNLARVLASTGRELLIRVGRLLRTHGHLSAAREAFARIDMATPAPRDLALVEAELTVLSGRWQPPVFTHARFDPIAGRILHVVGRSLPHAQDGYTVRTHSTVVAESGEGLDSHVVTQLGFPPAALVDDQRSRSVLDGITYHHLYSPDGVPSRFDERLSLNASRLADLVAELRPSVLHAHSDFVNALLATAVARHFQIPVIYCVRGFWEETWLSLKEGRSTEIESYRLRKERETALMKEADHVVTLADVMRDELIDRGVDAARITVVPNAVDSEKFVPVPRDAQIAARLGLADDETVIGYVSSLKAYEGISYLLEATARLLADGHRVRCLIVGDGDSRHELELSAERLGIADRVIFTGRVPHGDVLGYYSIIDIFVVPRTADSVSRLVTPLKPYEAMAAGRAVVVSDVPALREMVIPGRTGLVFRPEDPDDMAACLATLIVAPERRRRLGDAAREWVCSHRTWQGNGILLRSLYATLAPTRAQARAIASQPADA